jgi:hypothetical protein
MHFPTLYRAALLHGGAIFIQWRRGSQPASPCLFFFDFIDDVSRKGSRPLKGASVIPPNEGLKQHQCAFSGLGGTDDP